MKRVFTLITAIFALCAISMAQEVDRTIIFIDEQGNEVPDGTVLNVSSFTHIDDNGNDELKVPLKVKNISGMKAAVSMYETIDAKPNGVWQTCAFGNCLILNRSDYSPKNVVAGDYEADIMTEWLAEPGKYASWTATLQIHIFNIETQMTPWGTTQEKVGSEIIGYGPKVTVCFSYADPSGITMPTASATTGNSFSIGGLRTNTLRKGLNIVRLANGKVIKKMIK